MKKKKKKRSCWAAEPELERKKTVWLEPELETVKKKRVLPESRVSLCDCCRNRNRALQFTVHAFWSSGSVVQPLQCRTRERRKECVWLTVYLCCVGNFNLGRILLILGLGCPVQVQQTSHQKWSFLNFLRAARGSNGLRAFSGRAKKP